MDISEVGWSLFSWLPKDFPEQLREAMLIGDYERGNQLVSILNDGFRKSPQLDRPAMSIWLGKQVLSGLTGAQLRHAENFLNEIELMQ
jgi:hypothetical protein